MSIRIAKKYLSFSDRMGETAFAVIMVLIINGYVALSDLNTGFWYIVVVNLAACCGWGLIDALIYITSSSIDRNEERKKAILFKSAKDDEKSLNEVKKAIDGTFMDVFDDVGKEKIVREMLNNSAGVSVRADRLVAKKEALGGISIFLLYVVTGFILALPFFVMPNKFNAWILSNLIGSSFLFYYGTLLGKALGRNRLLLGVGIAGWGLLFLLISYLVWT